MRRRTMFFLKKVFQFRDKANPDMEKPFLDHLEDLRHTITRILVTLIIAMIACFALQEKVMEVLRKPVKDVWATHMQGTLPEGIDIADWEHAKDVLDRSQVLEGSERKSYLARFSPETRRLVEAAKYLRTSAVLPEDQKESYLTAVKAANPDLAGILNSLRDLNADPLVHEGTSLKMMSALAPTETFMLSMKLSFFAGIVVSFPFLLYFLLQFILPGLHAEERKILWPAMAVGFGLFILGVCFAYFLVLPRALIFFFEWDQSLGVGSDWRIGWYINFATQFTLLFGLSFELPVVIMALVKIGILTHEMMSRTRSYAVLAIVVLAAMITPTSDPMTLALMAVPMYLLYETCILLAWLDRRKELKREEAEARVRLARLLDEQPDLDPDGTEEMETEDLDDDDLLKPYSPPLDDPCHDADGNPVDPTKGFNGHLPDDPPTDDPDAKYRPRD